MKFASWTLSVFGVLATSAFASDINGTWKVWFTGPKGSRPKMVSEMTFDLKAEGDKVTGMAHMAKWPGDAPISEGRIDGDRVAFTVIGKKPWEAGPPLSSGYPKLVFTGTLKGDETEITLRWGSVMISGEGSESESTLEMEGRKVSASK